MTSVSTADVLIAPAPADVERPLQRADEARLPVRRSPRDRRVPRLLGPTALSLLLHGIAVVCLLVFTLAPPPADGIGANLSMALTADLPETTEEVEELEEVEIDELEPIEVPELPPVYMEEKPLPEPEELLEERSQREEPARWIEVPVSVASRRTRPEAPPVVEPPAPPPPVVRRPPPPRPRPRPQVASTRGRLRPLSTPLYYPDTARRQGIQGVARVRMLIRADGTVDDVRLASSSGYPVLDEAALHSVRQWRFAPPGQARRVVQPVRFRLH